MLLWDAPASCADVEATQCCLRLWDPPGGLCSGRRRIWPDIAADVTATQKRCGTSCRNGAAKLVTEMETFNQKPWPHFLLQLLPSALPGCFVGTPSAQHGPVPEAPIGNLIIADFDDEFRSKGLPLG